MTGVWCLKSCFCCGVSGRLLLLLLLLLVFVAIRITAVVRVVLYFSPLKKSIHLFSPSFLSSYSHPTNTFYVCSAFPPCKQRYVS